MEGHRRKKSTSQNASTNQELMVYMVDPVYTYAETILALSQETSFHESQHS
jgi:hypothetical protein